MVRKVSKHRKRTKRRHNRAGMMGEPPPPYEEQPPPHYQDHPPLRYKEPPTYEESERELMFPRRIDEGRISQLENDIRTIKREISSISQLENDIRTIKREISSIKRECLSRKSSNKRTSKKSK